MDSGNPLIFSIDFVIGPFLYSYSYMQVKLSKLMSGVFTETGFFGNCKVFCFGDGGLKFKKTVNLIEWTSRSLVTYKSEIFNAKLVLAKLFLRHGKMYIFSSNCSLSLSLSLSGCPDSIVVIALASHRCDPSSITVIGSGCM